MDRKTVHRVACLALWGLLAAPWLPVASAEAPSRYDLADLKALQNAFVEVADEVRPSVVAIRTYTYRDPDNPRSRKVPIPYSQGSGFVIDAKGYIATNYHVVEDSHVVVVIEPDGQKHEATITQTDLRSDLAVLKIDADHLEPVRFGNAGNVKVNQWAFACGNPFGLANDDGRTAVTYGVVSALERDMTERLHANPERQYYGNLIQTSAAINPGNSGGPLFDIEGRVIGVVTAIETSSGVSEGAGYAIPIDRNTRRVLDTLKAGRIVRYGYMGIRIEDVDPPPWRRVAQTRESSGARISGTTPGGPADRGGLKSGDIILDYDGTPIRDTDHLVRLVQYTPVGSTVRVTYLRKQVKRTAEVMLGDRDELLGFARTE